MITSGHVSLRNRIKSNQLEKALSYTPERGDDLRLFMMILLRCMPLSRINRVWIEETWEYKWPKNTYSENFHRQYAPTINDELGDDRPTLSTWYQVFCTFMIDKLCKRWPQGNDFRWENFHISPKEIERCVDRTTVYFGMTQILSLIHI